MSNPRAEAFKALRDAEASAESLPETVTVPAMEAIKGAMQKQAAALRRALEWMDAIETP